MSDLFAEPSDLLKEVPITTFTAEVTYDELHMATVARVTYDMAWSSGRVKPERKPFITAMLEALQPWLPTSQAGKMPKRIANYMFKQYRADTPLDVHVGIANYLASSVPPGGWTFDITNNLNWKAGDYGDRDACFLSSRRYVLEAMQEEGVHAIRFYQEARGEYIGNGRAWIAPSSAGPVVFNAYGPTLQLVAGRIKQLLPAHVQQVVILSNLGASSGHIHINSGTGIVIGDEQQVEEVDLRIFCSKDRPVTCYSCGQRFPRTSMNGVMGDNDEDALVCRDCFDNLWEMEYITRNYYRKSLLEEFECVIAGRVSDSGWYYEGEIIKVRALVRTVAGSFQNCKHCQRLTDGQLFISVGGQREDWCYICAKEAEMECRECSYYLPAGEVKCQCGSAIMRKRIL